MTGLSFARTQKTNVNMVAAQRLDTPFDPSMTYARTMTTPNGAPEGTAYSVDIKKMLTALHNDNIDDLVKITLGAQSGQRGISLWDVMFNHIRQDRIAGCLFSADENYHPLRQNRVLTTLQFLNPAMSASRFQSNVVEKNGTIGIGIYDAGKRESYVLLYRIAGISMVDEAKFVDGKPKKDTRHIYAVNCELERVYRIPAEGLADYLDVKDDLPEDHAVRHQFVEWIASAVNDPLTAYPWKPHFTPATTQRFNRERLETRLESEIGQATDVSYDEFEDMCRDIYNTIRNRRIATTPRNIRRDGQGQPREKTEGRRERSVSFAPPVIEVVTCDAGYIFAKLHPSGQNPILVKFPVPVEGDVLIREIFLLNEDLKNRLIGETSHVMALSEKKFGPKALLRYMTLNF